MLKAIFPLTLLLGSSLCSAEGISGFWQHPKDPVWIEVTSAAGNGLAVRNDNDPSSIGFAVLKEVTVGEQKGRWTGQVFVPQLGSYKRVELSLPTADTLKMKVKIGFLTRSLEWARVSEVPEAPEA
ncbi:MAG: DUF2147 domain-containing protein [Halieaceae bacterium]|nr:DUF2147 domain-containing protein [Halieaceae bacterium]